MTGCNDIEAYVDGTLSPAAHQAVEEHLRVCTECRATVEAYEAIGERLRATERELPLRPRVVNGAIARARAGEAPAPRWRPAVALGLTGLAAVVVAVAIWTAATSELDTGRSPASAELVDGDGSRRVHAGEMIAATTRRHSLLRLADGSRLSVAAGGALAITELNRHQTRFRLLRGRVVADVISQPTREGLVLEAGGFVVRVIGTRFFVNVGSSGGLDVGVVRGRVQVERGGKVLESVAGGERLRMGEGRAATRERLSSFAARDLEALLVPPVEEKRLDSNPRSLAPDTNETGRSQSAADAGKRKHTKRPGRGRHHKKGREAPDYDAWHELVANGNITRLEATVGAYLERHPRDARALSLLADGRRKARQWEDAVETYRRVVSVGTPAQANRARFLAATVLQDHLNRQKAAAELLRSYLRQGEAFRPLAAAAKLRSARAALSLGESERARSLLIELCREHPGTSAAAEAGELLERMP